MSAVRGSPTLLDSKLASFMERMRIPRGGRVGIEPLLLPSLLNDRIPVNEQESSMIIRILGGGTDKVESKQRRSLGIRAWLLLIVVVLNLNYVCNMTSSSWELGTVLSAA